MASPGVKDSARSSLRVQVPRPVPSGRFAAFVIDVGARERSLLVATLTGRETRSVSTAFVTGGSGFIGGRLIKRLVDEGWQVRALARSDSSAAKVSAIGAEPVKGDLGDAAGMRAGAEGCEFAFHAAAHLGEWGTREDFERDNVGGTRNALEGGRSAGVRRFVHVGTEAALLAGEPLVNVNEDAPLRPDSKALYTGDQGDGGASRT